MYVVIAYILGILVGILLGLIGGGGVFLFPINHFLLGQELESATAHSVFLVFIASLIGVIPRIRNKEVDWPTVFALGIPVSAGMLLVRLWLLGVIPDHLFYLGDFEVTRRRIVLFPFAFLLCLSFASMKGLILKDLKPQKEMRNKNPVRYYSLLIVIGVLVGVIPAFAGAGGGVLIIPILVVLFGLPMKTVVGTSLAVVTMKSSIGFFGGDLFSNPGSVDVLFLAQFSIAIVVGAIIGSRVAYRYDGVKLKSFFAWVILILAIYIFWKELFFAGDVAADAVGLKSAGLIFGELRPF